MADERLGQTLSLSRRAGKLVWGFDAVKARLGGGVVRVFFARDLAEGSRRRMARLAEEKGVPCADLPLTLDALWFYIGKRAGILALTDEGLAARAAALLTAPAPQAERPAASDRPDQ